MLATLHTFVFREGTEMLKCPKCVGILESNTIGHIGVDVCFICNGIWVDQNSLENIIRSKSGFFSNFSDCRTIFEEEEDVVIFNNKKGDCPACAPANKMKQRKYRSVLIDYCPNGHGIWLDGGELNNLILNNLKIKYGIFWIIVYLVLCAAVFFSPARVFRPFRFGGGSSGGAGSSG